MKKEELLEAWVGLSGMLKNTRLTIEMPYNESIIMMYLYKQFKKDGIGELPVSSIIECTKMLKSLVNRTLNALEKQDRIRKIKHDHDSRRLYVLPTQKGLNDFMIVHSQSLNLAEKVIQIIGEEDACAIIRAYHRLSGLKIEEKGKL